MKCSTHPRVETNLRCGKCDKYICPKCMVQTPVGARCPECARLYRLPTYQISATYYLRAGGTALGMAIVCGVAWGLIAFIVPFFYLNLVIAAGIGYAIGEVVGLSVNRKRGTGLAVIGGSAVVVSYLVGTLFPLGLHFGLFDLLALAAGIFVAVTRLR